MTFSIIFFREEAMGMENTSTASTIIVSSRKHGGLAVRGVANISPRGDTAQRARGLYAQGQRRGRKQSGHGGQTKPIFHKKANTTEKVV